MRDLKGTILLSPEGINLFIAGQGEVVDQLMERLRAIPGLAGLKGKISVSEKQPFNRMLVRLKKEIISFGQPDIDPASHTSPKLPPATLAQWLDEGRPLLLLDTRNDYEVKLGTFRGAHSLGIETFRQFPGKVRDLPSEMREQPVVMFCTGGIRCEKAGPFMEQEGFKEIYQLDGGILKYFEECGGAHYEGECFVFDQRVGVDPALEETASAVCFECQTPLTADDQADPRYQPGESCPHCYDRQVEERRRRLKDRQAALRACFDPLPGSQPYENFRPFRIPGAFDGQSLAAFLRTAFAHQPLEFWEARCREGRLLNAEYQPVHSLDHRVRSGERYFRALPGTVEPDVNPAIEILDEDDALIVISKPAPMPTHSGGRYNRNTVLYGLKTVYAPEQPRICHRLDANTTGLMVLARSRRFAAHLQAQFAEGTVAKRYLARVQGWPETDDFESRAPISAGSGPLGSRTVDREQGLRAHTVFHVIERLSDGTALLEIEPKTGRTNQIRVHLWDLGLPICGDPAYLSGHGMGEAMTLGIQDPPLCLHAWRLRLQHPSQGQWVGWEAPMPGWATTREQIRVEEHGTCF